MDECQINHDKRPVDPVTAVIGSVGSVGMVGMAIFMFLLFTAAAPLIQGAGHAFSSDAFGGMNPSIGAALRGDFSTRTPHSSKHSAAIAPDVPIQRADTIVYSATPALAGRAIAHPVTSTASTGQRSAIIAQVRLAPSTIKQQKRLAQNQAASAHTERISPKTRQIALASNGWSAAHTGLTTAASVHQKKH
jgi:hypothetical protein